MLEEKLVPQNVTKSQLQLKDFCKIEELFTILENWSNGTGLSAIIIDNNGTPISKSYGMSPFCQLLHNNEKSFSLCKNDWKEKKYGIHKCHAGFYDFAIPLILPDDSIIGKVLAGQILSEEQNINEIVENVSNLGIPKDEILQAINSTPRKKKAEIEGSYNLLTQMIQFFIEKSYSAYQEIEARKADIRMLTAAVKTVYRISMYFNITRNEYHLIDVKDGVNKILPESGTIDSIVNIGSRQIPNPEQAQKYYDLFNREALIKAYKEGKTELSLQHEQIIFNGETHWMEGRLVFVDCSDNEITAICLSKVIDEEIQNKLVLSKALENSKKQQALLQEALDNYKQADYDRRRDFLTGLRNRQDMFDLFNDTLSGKRSQIKAMFMMDIDNFKNLNDNYGHKYGDVCLEKIGNALNKYSEKNNINFYRYGGEEILGICFDDKKDYEEIAQELVTLVSKLKIKREDTEFGVVTISLGYTTDNSRYEKMIDKADLAMYQAKKSGKNQYFAFEELKK